MGSEGRSAAEWFEERTYQRAQSDVARLAQLKLEQDQRVAVCLPALDEEATVGAICSTIKKSFMGSEGLVDRLVVMDSGSGDATREVAAAAGAEVYRSRDVLPRIGSEGGGKGDTLWRSLACIDSDLIVWIDSDIQRFDAQTLPSLIAPLLEESGVHFVKGFYSGSLETTSDPLAPGGGRLTELVARPLLSLFYPQLAHVVQPLTGELAGRRTALLSLPFVTGYGVEMAMLIDIVATHGLWSLAQVDLGSKSHNNRPLTELGSAAYEIVQAVLSRLRAEGRMTEVTADALIQFGIEEGHVRPIEVTDRIAARPPMATIQPED
jgi:glucosyl-3-phosphoglycerate synthase